MKHAHSETMIQMDKAYSATRNFTTYCNLNSLNLDMKFTCRHRLYFCCDHTVDSQIGQGTTDQAACKCYVLRKQKCNNQQSINEWSQVRQRINTAFSNLSPLHLPALSISSPSSTSCHLYCNFQFSYRLIVLMGGGCSVGSKLLYILCY